MGMAYRWAVTTNLDDKVYAHFRQPSQKQRHNNILASLAISNRISRAANEAVSRKIKFREFFGTQTLKFSLSRS